MTDPEYHETLIKMQEAALKLTPQPGEEINEEFFADRKRKIKALKKEIDDEINRLEVDHFLEFGPQGTDPEMKLV